MNGLTDLFKSERGIIGLALLIGATVLTGIGAMSIDRWEHYSLWVFGIYVAGKTTGAHLNPAVTIALAAFRSFPWRKVIPYSIAQIAGAFVAAALVFWNYHPAFLKVDPALDHTAGVFTCVGKIYGSIPDYGICTG